MLYDIGRMTKTIVFCSDIEEAAEMRTLLINMNSDLCKKSPYYVTRIVGEDKEGKKQLDNFISVDEPYPVIVTTSELLSTGVDCKTCGLIVIDKEIGSMTEFKQIIGRGTRLRKDKASGIWKSSTSAMLPQNSKTRHLTATLNHPKAVEKSRSHIRLFPQILQQLTNLVKSILSMERIFVLLMR
ncbi:MAG: helicase-related protein [Parabacteroides merdae]